MTNEQFARELANEIMRHPNLSGNTRAIKAALDAAWREGVEAAARECDTEVSARVYPHDVGWSVADACAKRIRALLPPDAVTAPQVVGKRGPISEYILAAGRAKYVTERPETQRLIEQLRKAEVKGVLIRTDYWTQRRSYMRLSFAGAAADEIERLCSELDRAIASASTPEGSAPPDPVTAPGHTDLTAVPDPVGALARLFAHGWQNAHLDFDKAHKLGLLTCVGVGRYIISDMGSAAIALARRGDNK